MNNKPPRVFISYSQEDKAHKDWVKGFADKLIGDGVDAHVDQYDLHLGDRLPQFMEKEIEAAEYVLIICTPIYKQKSDRRAGGVGFEGHIISGELLTKSNERKFITVIRKGSFEDSMPSYLEGKASVDLRGDPMEESQYQKLVAHLLGRTPQASKPKVGFVSAHAPMNNVAGQEQPQEVPIHIIGVATDEVTMPRNDETHGSALYKIPFQLSKVPSSIWRELFLHHWNRPSSFTSMHRPGIASVVGDEIILDGTTIEEVQKYHKQTLEMAVKKANEGEQQYLEEQRLRQIQEEQMRQEHNDNVARVASRLIFN